MGDLSGWGIGGGAACFSLARHKVAAMEVCAEDVFAFPGGLRSQELRRPSAGFEKRFHEHAMEADALHQYRDFLLQSESSGRELQQVHARSGAVEFQGGECG